MKRRTTKNFNSMSSHVQYQDVHVRAKQLSFRIEDDNDNSQIIACMQIDLPIPVRGPEGISSCEFCFCVSWR